MWRALADVTDKYNTTTQDYNVYTGYYQPTYVTYTYKDGETGETKVQDDLSKVPNSQWKENVYYTDGASVKFGNLWLPEEWEKYLDTGNTTLESFQKLLTSSEVALGNGSKDGETDPAHGSGLFQSASTKITTRTSNGVSVTIDGITYGVDDEDNVNQVYGVFKTTTNTDGSSTTTFTKTTRDGISDYYERVMIDGTVRPGYITVNSDYELEIGGQSVAMKDDTNYVFRNYTDAEGKVHAGCIADASSRVMHDIYGDVVSTDETWRTKLAKGGTGTLIIETENTFSGGSDLHGGLIVMKNQQALGWSAESLKEGTFSKGGDIEMAYGAALMADYVSVQHTADDLGEELQEGVITNHLVIIHAADYDEALWKVTGDAQIMNRWDTECRLDTLESYRDAVLTLRGVSRSKEDADTGIITTLDGKEVTEYKNTYADFAINTPKGARGTIRMAGYLYGDDGRIVNSETDEKGVTTYSYAHTGGNVQLTISGHMKEGDVDPTVRWEETTIDLSLNGSAHTVLALETRFKKDNVTENPGLTKTLVLGTLMDDGNSGGNACVINDASSKRMDLYYKDKGKEAYLVELTLKPTTDASFSGNVGFGIGQNAAGYALPSRGYISLVKAGSATQTIGNARLLDLNVGIGGETKDAATEEGGLLHITHALSVRSITTAGTWTTISSKDVVATLGRVMVGEVNETQSSHTLIVGAGGILAFETKQLSDKPLAGLKPTENQDKYGRDFSYILLQSATDSTVRDETSADSQTRTTPQSKEGAIVTAAGNYTISQSITVAKGSDVTFNTHEYSMDSTVSSTMDVYGQIAADMRDAFDKSHIIKLDGVFVAPEVTLNFTNKQISESAKGTNLWGTATYQGYILVKDMNEFTGNISGQDSTVYQEFGVSGTVNIGAMTCVQVTSSAAKKDNKFGTYQSLKCNQDVTEGSIDYNITGTNAALQFIENGSSGYNSFIKSAVLSDGGSVLMGGMAASEKAAGVIEGNATKADIDIRNNVDLVITNKTTVDEEGNSVADGEAKLSGFKLNTANQADQSVCGNTITVETALGGADKNTHAKIDNARVIAQTTNNLLEHTDLTNTLVEIQKNMTLYMSDVTLDSDSKIQGEVVAQTRSGTADGKVVNDRPGAQSNAYTDTATRVSVTLTQDNANTVTSNTQNKLQVMKVNQLANVNMLGSGLTIGISQETLESYRATCDILALEVTGTGIFTYEANGTLSGVQLADTTTGNIYATTDTSNPIAIADSAYVAYLLGVEKAQVSMNYIYIVLPEPTTGTLSLLALAALCARRRRTGAGKV